MEQQLEDGGRMCVDQRKTGNNSWAIYVRWLDAGERLTMSRTYVCEGEPAPWSLVRLFSDEEGVPEEFRLASEIVMRARR